MGSLNGDIIVMRNGRSTSQVSVYNYPEHLNPFYEDDQHKRLRFWKISKQDNEGRRNSFSIANLRDMWAFKSFRTKKKSSTLGINKTSESPPILRRNYVVDNGWNTFDHRLRCNNTSSINGDCFQRNATYRSSLQTLPTNQDRIGLNRNDGYRSTIQVTRSYPRYQVQHKQQQQQRQQQQQQQTMGVSQHNRRYVYGGSVTPQPFRNVHTNLGRGPYEYDCDNVMIRRSSESSMISTNPFELDDDENEDINSSGIRSVNGGSTTTLTSRTPRKKRRAPAPPTPIHGASPPTIRIESSHESTQDELRIKEDNDIANLTAEIECFVKTKSNDAVEITPKCDVKTTNATESTTTSANTSFNDVKNVGVEKNREKESYVTTTPLKCTSKITTTTTSNSKENNKQIAQTNGQVTSEIITVTTTTTTKTTNADVIKPLEKETNVAQISNKNVTKADESKEIETNEALPKKPNSNNNNNTVTKTLIDQQQQQSTTLVTDLCINESNREESPQRPLPLKRHTKPEAEVGHVECIHVHVESPKATPRKDHPSGVSSFKYNETIEPTETITIKTPFILTSPPTQRRKPLQTNVEPVIKETVKIVGSNAVNDRTNKLNIKEEHLITKPEISIKPTLSPKPVTKVVNGKMHGFAEIHKPIRKFTNIQNGHIKIATRDESIPSPTVPQQKPIEEEKKINSSDAMPNSIINGIHKMEEFKKPQDSHIGSLKVIETTTTITDNSGTCEDVEREKIKAERKVNFETLVNSGTTVSSNKKRDDEFELLYRPKPASHMEWKRSTLAPLETNIPPEKRKSVKDIIESINRSQRLLNAAANKDFPALQTQATVTTNSTTVTDTATTVPTSSDSLDENLKILDERQREIQLLVDEMTPSTFHTTTTSSPTPSNCNNEYAEAQKLDNKEIFQKCKVKKEVYDYRETSPISSNLDWNPVPKPKRTKPGHE